MTTRILVPSDVRGVRSDEGIVLATHPAGEFPAFAALRDAAGAVTVVSRDATSSKERPPTGRAMTGPGVGYVGVPDYDDWAGLLRGLPMTAVRVWRAVGDHDAVYVRLPEPLSVLVALVARLRRRPVLANVVADASTLQVPGAARIARIALAFLVRRVVRRAAGVVYVTKVQLQAEFPPPPGVPTLFRSNVRLEALADGPRNAPPSGRARLVIVGTNTRLSKGQDVVLEAVRELVDRGTDASAVFVGGGDRTQWLRDRAVELGIADRCQVMGHVSDPVAIRRAYEEADIFCLPSRSEGLPRAMVEAMATGLPAVGTAVGGVPELLAARQIIREATAVALADVVTAMIADPGEYVRASNEALMAAREVQASTSPPAFRSFFDSVMESLT